MKKTQGIGDNNVKTYYCIELDSTKPQVLEYPIELINEDLEHYGIKNPLHLSDFDLKVFQSESDANEYLETYNKTKKSLKNSDICVSRDLPAILYKRRYIVQSVLGEKMYTERNYLKNWKVGQLVNLHDQVFFLTVKIKKITEVEKGIWRYDFELVK